MLIQIRTHLKVTLLALILSTGSLAASPGTIVHPSIWPLAKPKPEARNIDAIVRPLLRRMTIEEKVGQIIQADISSISPSDLALYPLGSILNGGDSGPGGNNKAPATEWLHMIAAYRSAARLRPGAAIPLLWGTDAVHGQNKILGATIFPHNIGLGAAHDPALVEQIGIATAVEVVASGPDWVFAPTLAVARNNHWGRTYESYSEDPGIVALYAGAMVEGLQGRLGTAAFLAPGHVVATAKHFLGDGGTTGGKDEGDTVATEAELRDIQCAGYPPAIAAGVQTVMVSYSSWNGIKMHGNHGLVTDVLKGRMGFKGFVIGDWNGHAQVPGCTAQDCPAAINAGVDMIMAPVEWKAFYINTLREVRSGIISQARLNDAVSRILSVKARAGLFSQHGNAQSSIRGDLSLLGTTAHRALARQAVRESLVLLKNSNHILPLRPGMTVLVTGPAADSIPLQCGGWTLDWQGSGNSNVDFPHAQSIFGGIREAVSSGGGTAILSSDGQVTSKPDVAIVVFGEDPYAEAKGDIRTTSYSALYPEPLALLRRLKKAGIPTISVFLSGRPLWTDPEIAASDAFIAAWLPGGEGGGVADLLFSGHDGKPVFDFRGRLSFSWPIVPDQVTGRGTGAAPRFYRGYGLTLNTTHAAPF